MPAIDSVQNHKARPKVKVRPKAKTPAPKPKSKPYVLPKSFKPADTTQRPAGDRTAADQEATLQRKRGVQKRAAQKRERVRKAFTEEPIRATRKAQQRAIQSLSDLRQSDPEGYQRKLDARARLDARRKDGDTHIGPFNIEAELEGRGGLQKASRAAGKAITKINDIIPDQLQGSDKNSPLMKHGVVSKSSVGTEAIGKEAIDLAANLPSSLYVTGAAAKEAAQGRPGRAKEQWKAFKETSAIPPALKGNFREAAKRAQEHPVTTVLEVSGAKAALGRGAGAVTRHAPLPKGKVKNKVRSVGSTKRENLRLYEDVKPGEGPEIAREYSKDLINKAAQVYSDRRTRKGSRVRRRGSKAGTQRRPGRDPNIDRGAVLVPTMPRRMGGGGGGSLAQPSRSHLNRRVDTRVFAHERARQGRKAHTIRSVSKIVPTGRLTRYPGALRKGRVKPEEAAGVQLIAEGTARAGRDVATRNDVARVRSDLRKRLLALAKERKNLDEPERLRLNKDEAAQIRKILKMPDSKLVTQSLAAREFAKQQGEVQARGRRVGAWDETAQAKRFYPYLQSHVRMPKGEERTGLTAEERRIAAKSLQRRARRRKPIPQGAMKAIQDEYLNEVKAAVAGRKAGEVYPTETLARAIIALGEGKVPEGLNNVRDVPRRNRVGQSKGITRDTFNSYLQRHTRRQPVAARKLDQGELERVSRVLQRRSRRGKVMPAGMPQEGPTLITQRPVRKRPDGGTAGENLRNFPTPLEPTHTRKGTAFEQGAREVGADALMRQAVQAESQATAAEGFQLLDREFGRHAGDNGRRYAGSYDEAMVNARKINDAFPSQPAYVPVNIAQFRTFGTRLRRKQEEGMKGQTAATQESASMQAAMEETWNAALGESGRGRWVLMPEDVVHRLQEHARVGTHGPLHAATNVFKDVVLTTSSPARWIGGNVTDISMRTGMEGITPLDIVRGRKIVRNAAGRGLQGEQAAAAITGGGLYHASEALNRATGRQAIGEHPARTVLAAPWRVWKGGVYAIEHAIEELPQFGAVGKSMRKEPGSTYWRDNDGTMKRDLASLMRMHDQQIDSYAARMATDRALEAKIQKTTEDVIGRWGKVSPNMRRALVIAPFAQWLGAATRYVFMTLPGRHPMKSAILAGISQMSEEERKALGLSYYLPRDKQAYDYQMGTLPTSVKKGKYGLEVKGPRTARMTSLGTASEAAAGNISGFLFPQFAGALDAWAGTSFTNDKLVYPEWWPEVEKRGLELPPDERQKIGLGALLESSIPFASAFRRSILEEGKPAEPYSTILTPATRKKWDKENKQYVENKGTAAGGILEWLMPFSPPSRVYTYGAGKSISDTRTTQDTLKKWQELPKKSEGYGFKGGSDAARTPNSSYGFDKPQNRKQKKEYGFGG